MNFAFTAIFAAMTAVSVRVCIATSVPEKWRVYEIGPANFAYTLVSVFAGADGRSVMSFNNRRGRTTFVRVGESLGQYSVEGVQSVTSRVFNASINAWERKVTWTAILKKPDGDRLELVQDKPAPGTGLMATVVALDTGEQWVLAGQDRISVAGTNVDVVSLSSTSMVVTVCGSTTTIASISEGEKAWFDRERSRLLDLARQKPERVPATNQVAEAAPDVFLPQRAQARVQPRRVFEIKNQPRFFFGTEYYIPTGFRVSPGTVDQTGRTIVPTVVYPSAFERRITGMSVR